jgi:hypothetical protein
MSFIQEWQLVAHTPKDLTPAEGAVLTAIARRIRPGNNSEEIPFRTIYAESVGVKSKDTIKRALEHLEALGVIQVSKSPRGSRRPSTITWALECPLECALDHANGNRKATKTKLEKEFEAVELESATRPTPQDTTRPTPQDTLRSKERERTDLVSFVRETLLELAELTPQQTQLLEALTDPEEAGKVRTRAEEFLIDKDPSDPWAYLAAIARKDPQRLFPKPQLTQAPPNLSHLPAEIREAQLRKLSRPDPFAHLKAAAND